MADNSLRPILRFTISSMPSSVANRQPAPTLIKGMGIGQTSSPITIIRLSSPDFCQTKKFCAARKAFMRSACVPALSVETMNFLYALPKMAISASSSSFFKASSNAFEAASGVGKIYCSTTAVSVLPAVCAAT